LIGYVQNMGAAAGKLHCTVESDEEDESSEQQPEKKLKKTNAKESVNESSMCVLPFQFNFFGCNIDPYAEKASKEKEIEDNLESESSSGDVLNQLDGYTMARNQTVQTHKIAGWINQDLSFSDEEKKPVSILGMSPGEAYRSLSDKRTH